MQFSPIQYLFPKVSIFCSPHSSLWGLQRWAGLCKRADGRLHSFTGIPTWNTLFQGLWLSANLLPDLDVSPHYKKYTVNSTVHVICVLNPLPAGNCQHKVAVGTAKLCLHRLTGLLSSVWSLLLSPLENHIHTVEGNRRMNVISTINSPLEVCFIQWSTLLWPKHMVGHQPQPWPTTKPILRAASQGKWYG